MSAIVRIKDGIATNEDLKARTPQFDIAGSGRFQLQDFLVAEDGA